MAKHKKREAQSKPAALDNSGRRALVILLGSLLFLAVLGTYLPALRNDFINYDDHMYVTTNRQVQGGLTLHALVWALRSTVGGNWHPLTWLSHMLDCQLFGLQPWGHHLTSILLHAVNALLVFVVFRKMTGAIWRSLLVAALFGLHPLHVESVAWVAERKDVLSTLFWLLTLWAYTDYAQKAGRQPAVDDHPGHSWLEPLACDFYWLALLFFTLGLMCKPMLVTLPFALLLLDYWPLRRLPRERLRGDKPAATGLDCWPRLAAEKAPFFLLSAIVSAVTFLIQRSAGAVAPISRVSLDYRLKNVLISYCRYLGKIFWPAHLSIAYPQWPELPAEQVLLAGVLLLVISVLAIVFRRRLPYLPVGWFWFLGTLIPVIGLVQVGDESMADRYTYVPSLGLFLVLAWGAGDLARRWRPLTVPLSTAAVAATIACVPLTWRQLGYWRNSETLFRYARAVEKNNYTADDNLGIELARQGRYAEALPLYAEAVELRPNFAGAHSNLGVELARQGRLAEAIVQFREALRLQADYPNARYNLAETLRRNGQLDEAIVYAREAIQLLPDYPNGHYTLGDILVRQNHFDEAVHELQIAVALKPDYVDARNDLAVALYNQGRSDEAITQYQEVLNLDPAYVDAYNDLGVALSSQGRYDEAINEFNEALKLKPDFAQARANLADAQAKKVAH